MGLEQVKWVKVRKNGVRTGKNEVEGEKNGVRTGRNELQ